MREHPLGAWLPLGARTLAYVAGDAVSMQDATSRTAAGRAIGWIFEHIDRGPTWGSIEVRPERYGVVRYRLTIYPPGTDMETRRWLTAQEAWCGSGLVCATVAAVLLMPAFPPAIALTISGALYLIGGVVIRRRTRTARRSSRRLFALEFGERSTAEELEHCACIRRAASIMADADSSLRAGELTPVEHEVVWARTFAEVGALSARGQSSI